MKDIVEVLGAFEIKKGAMTEKLGVIIPHLIYITVISLPLASVYP